jgi:copper chaperone CopZ
MGLAKFVARDPYTPAMAKQELEELITKIHGIIEWTIQPDGEVTIEYDKQIISDELVEEALDGVGFELKHIFDDPDADETEVKEALAE